VDVFEPGPGAQLHDLNPSDYQPTGLFWTIEIPESGIQVNLGNGYALMEANNVPIFDYGNIPNSLFGPNALLGPPRTPGTVSFRVIWSGVQERLQIRNTDPVFGGFAGEFIRNVAQMEWTAITDDYTFVSAPLATSSSSFAEIGHERNGSFFP